MLVLSRREGESIIIGGNIKVMVTQIKGGMVQIGIDAPADVAVHREEFQDQLNANGEQWKGHDPIGRALTAAGAVDLAAARELITRAVKLAGVTPQQAVKVLRERKLYLFGSEATHGE